MATWSCVAWIWSAEYVLGNLKRDRFEDLYRSETFRRVLRGLRDPSVDLLCRTCHVAQSGAAKDRLMTAIHNIPGIGPVAAQTLSRLKRGTINLAHFAFQTR
jgi:Iron-sulfur cluster-binding domain